MPHLPPGSNASRPAQGRGLQTLRTTVRPATAAPLLLVSGAAVGMFSVSRYALAIVVTYVVLLAVLLMATMRGRPPRPAGPAIPAGPAMPARPGAAPAVGVDRIGGAAALAAAGLAVWAVPSFSYVPGPQLGTLRLTVAIAAGVAGVLTALPWRHGPGAALVVAAAAYAATAAATIRLDPAPRIDVWYTLQAAADGLLRGENMYDSLWVGPPGPMAAFTYLPWAAVLSAPGRWLAGDVRWALVSVTLCTVVAFTAFARRPVAAQRQVTTDGHPSADSAWIAGALLLLLPGTLTQVEQAWTEPVLLACLTGAVLALTSGRDRLAVLALALALASKQHVVLLLPVLAAWPRFGLRRSAAAAVTAAVLVLPWLLADPAAMWHDTVELLVTFPPLRFANTVYIAVLNEFGVQLPFWVTGAAVVGTVAGAALAVRRRDPEPAGVLRWCALVLLVANLVNKQAFYNQYWLVAGLVLASWAASARPPLTGERRPAAQPATSEV